MSMDGELTTIVSQFGSAGLMGLLWILERRHAALRDRQLTDAHRRLESREADVAALLGVVRDNTRAIVMLEQTQRGLLRSVERLSERFSPPDRRRPAVQTMQRHDAIEQRRAASADAA